MSPVRPGSTPPSKVQRAADRADQCGVKHLTELVVAGIAALGFAAVAIAAPFTPVLMSVVAWIAITIATASLVRIGISRPMIAERTGQRIELVRARNELESRRTVDSVLAQLDRGLAAATTIAQVQDQLGRAATRMAPDREHRVVGSGCRAIDTARPATVLSTDDAEACDHLAEDGETSAACVPLGSRRPVASACSAAICSLGPAGELPDPHVIAGLAAAARRAGDRILALGRAQDTDDGPIDAVTGLPGRDVALRALGNHLTDLVPVAVALVDLDNFRGYLDHHGDTGADHVIQTVADAICCTVRPGDTVVRDGQDRFMVIFPDCLAPAAAAAMERVREAIVLEATEEEIAPITASVGIAASNRHAGVDALLEAADVALSVAKHQGGNRISRSDLSRTL